VAETRAITVTNKKMDSPMHIFLDTEFTQPENSTLISLALVAEDGDEFYVEVADFDRQRCSPFVKTEVLPLLGQPDALILPYHALSATLHGWLDQYAEMSPVICYDYLRDWQLMREALDCKIPRWLTYRNIWSQMDTVKRAQFWEASRLPPHHALHDARCLAYATGHAIANTPQREGT
jgi:hypothetical protein